MKVTQFNYCMLHSLIGKNDGVSIVIDQCVHSMLDDMHIPLGNIFFLAAHISPRFNAETDEIFWHKNEIHKTVIRNFSSKNGAEHLDKTIHNHALRAKERIAEFVKKNDIDVIIAHNTTHPYNLITAVGLGYFIEEVRATGETWPKVIVWWHDSYFERERFLHPSPVIQKYLKYLPGNYIDGLVLINSEQPSFARDCLSRYGLEDIDDFFEKKAVVIPNTSDIPWNWHEKNWDCDELLCPPQDNYNDPFFYDNNIDNLLGERGYALDDAVLLLQHTRVVPRKRIETAIDFAFRIAYRYKKDGAKKCVVLLVSGHSGDEQAAYKKTLEDYYEQQADLYSDVDVLLVFGEQQILSHRDIIVDRKYYRFSEIPSIIAAHGGIGTYFSEIEGYGNNLLEMVRSGLPAVINKYPIYCKDIEPLGFDFPSIINDTLTDDVVEQGYQLLTNMKARNKHIAHNLKVLEEKLPHETITYKLKPLLEKVLRA